MWRWYGVGVGSVLISVGCEYDDAWGVRVDCGYGVEVELFHVWR